MRLPLSITGKRGKRGEEKRRIEKILEPSLSSALPSPSLRV